MPASTRPASTSAAPSSLSAHSSRSASPAARASSPRRPGVARARAGVAGVGGDVGPTDQHPARGGAQRERLHQARRAAQPAARGGVVAETHPVGEGEVEGGHHGPLRVGEPAERGVGALPAAQRGLSLAEPPQRDAEPEQRRARLRAPEHRLERLPGGGPFTGLDRLLRPRQKRFRHPLARRDPHIQQVGDLEFPRFAGHGRACGTALILISLGECASREAARPAPACMRVLFS